MLFDKPSKVSLRCSSSVVFITGGMAGVQETFAKHCKPGSRVYNMLPQGESSGYGVGTDITAGAGLGAEACSGRHSYGDEDTEKPRNS